MKYKVGDKVKIKSLDWYNANKTENGWIESNVNHEGSFAGGMSTYCGKVAIITKVHERRYNLDIDNGCWDWYDFMFDKNFKDMGTKKIILPKGWEIDRVENGDIILKESKKELPKTWEECILLFKKYEHIKAGDILPREVRDIEDVYANALPIGLGKPLLALCQLLVCREIYRNGWMPDWKDDTIIPVIEYHDGSIVRSDNCHTSCILAFQTEEVRDQFLENFKDLIEEAKELI